MKLKLENIEVGKIYLISLGQDKGYMEAKCVAIRPEWRMAQFDTEDAVTDFVMDFREILDATKGADYVDSTKWTLCVNVDMVFIKMMEMMFWEASWHHTRRRLMLRGCPMPDNLIREAS